jgi:outer membrane immunogenic protein
MGMRKAVFGITALAGLMLAGSAQAADMPVKAPPRQAPIYSDWTGFYLFGFGGYSWGKIKPDDVDLGHIGLHNPKPKGGVFGFGGGYNWQYGTWVAGVEVDYGFSDEKEDQTIGRTCGDLREALVLERSVSCPPRIRLHSKIDALGSARLRAGWLFTPNLLAYGTAGLGWGRSELNIADALIAKPTLFGWVAGGGLEYQLFQRVRVRGEYLHYDFGSTSYAFQPFFTINAKTTDDVVRGALIWSFN